MCGYFPIIGRNRKGEHAIEIWLHGDQRRSRPKQLCRACIEAAAAALVNYDETDANDLERATRAVGGPQTSKERE